MMVKHLLVPVAVLLTGGCASAAPPEPDIGSIIRRCGLEGRISIRFVDPRALTTTHLDPQATYEEVDCFLSGVRRLGLRLGFVGNVAPAPE